MNMFLHSARDSPEKSSTEKWSTMPYFKQLDELEGIPVINLHMWFDKKLNDD